MHVVLEYNSVLHSRFSGMYTAGQGLLSGLVQHSQISRVTLLAWKNLLQKSGDFPLRSHPKVRVIETAIRPRRLNIAWRIAGWPKLSRWVGDFDVYHSLHHLMPPCEDRPRVLTVHDLRRYRLGELAAHSKVAAFERAVRAADRILAISQSAKDDLVEILHVPADKVDVAYLAAADDFVPATSPQRRDTLGWLSKLAGKRVGSYVLSVGSLDRRKNIPAAIQGFAHALPQLPTDASLVLAGEMPKDVDVADLIRQSQLQGRVILTGVLAQPHFQALLACAVSFLFLSLYEGFGLPLLEAMASGVPVIGAINSCIPEVVGKAGLLVGSGDAAGIGAAIVDLARDDARRAQFIAAGFQRKADFSWQRTADAAVACYQRAIESRRTCTRR